MKKNLYIFLILNIIFENFLSASYQMRKKFSAFTKKASQPFESEIYTKMIEPLYVGNKAPYWYQSYKDIYKNYTLNEHERFFKRYKEWKYTLEKELYEEYKFLFFEYEQLFKKYKRNKSHTKTLNDLIDLMITIEELIQETNP